MNMFYYSELFTATPNAELKDQQHRLITQSNFYKEWNSFHRRCCIKIELTTKLFSYEDYYFIKTDGVLISIIFFSPSACFCTDTQQNESTETRRSALYLDILLEIEPDRRLRQNDKLESNSKVMITTFILSTFHFLTLKYLLLSSYSIYTSHLISYAY